MESILIKGMVIMRKYIIGAMFGFSIALCFNTSAAEVVESVIGKSVTGTFPVTVEGERLSKDAVVIDNSTYLPVRDFGEAIGYNVNFDAEMGVKMTKTAEPRPEKKLNRLNRDIEEKNETLKAFKDDLKYQEDNSDAYIKAYGEDAHKQALADKQAKITQLEAELADLEKQKAELSK